MHKFDKERHSAIESLMDCEARFIQDMSLGVQLFSRPLRHCVISHSEHMQLFQNVEKLVTISEYHLNQITTTLQPGASYKPRVNWQAIYLQSHKTTRNLHVFSDCCCQGVNLLKFIFAGWSSLWCLQLLRERLRQSSRASPTNGFLSWVQAISRWGQI